MTTRMAEMIAVRQPPPLGLAAVLPGALMLSVSAAAYAAYCSQISKTSLRKLLFGSDEKTNPSNLLFTSAFVLCAFLVAFLFFLIAHKFSA